MSSQPQPIPSPSGGERPARPTPVRVLMEGGAEEAPPSERTFEVDGAEWAARVLGVTSAGTAPDVRAHVVLVGFSRASEAHAMEREAMAPVSSLEDLSDDQLVDLLAASRPARHPEGTQETG